MSLSNANLTELDGARIMSRRAAAAMSQLEEDAFADAALSRYLERAGPSSDTCTDLGIALVVIGVMVGALDYVLLKMRAA